MSWLQQRTRLQRAAREVDPAIRLYNKDNWFCKLLAGLLFLVSFGNMKPDEFLHRFATTIGPFQFYPEYWSTRSVEAVLFHESRHTRQARWFGLWIHPWVGLPLYGLLYLFAPLPLGFAWLRFWFELDADRFAWRKSLKTGLVDTHAVTTRAARFSRTLCSYKYVWPIPRCWGVPLFEEAAGRVCAEHEKHNE